MLLCDDSLHFGNPSQWPLKQRQPLSVGLLYVWQNPFHALKKQLLVRFYTITLYLPISTPPLLSVCCLISYSEC